LANAAAPRSAPSPAARRAWQWLGLPALCLLSTLLLLNNEVLPLGAVRAEDLASDYGLLTWNLWATTESALRGESPYHTRLLYHPLGANLAVHTLGPGFAPLGILMRAVLGGRSDYPLYAHRLAIVVCFALGMLLAYRALCAMGASAPAAVAGGVGWAFAACWRLIVANQTLSAACFLLPAVTLGVVAFVRRPSTVRLAVLALLVGAGVYFSEYFAVFIAAAVLVVALAATTSSGTRAVLSRCAALVAPPRSASRAPPSPSPRVPWPPFRSCGRGRRRTLVRRRRGRSSPGAPTWRASSFPTRRSPRSIAAGSLRRCTPA